MGFIFSNVATFLVFLMFVVVVDLTICNSPRFCCCFSILFVTEIDFLLLFVAVVDIDDLQKQQHM